MNLLVSACLLGVCCRYNGKGERNQELVALMDKHTLIPVCPEQLGGMMTPRAPSEIYSRQAQRESTLLSPTEKIAERKVTNRDGADVTEFYRKGAEETLKLAQLYGCGCAVLKERSPSCGNRQIYDGTFTGTLIKGQGITAELLEKNGIRVLGESQLKMLETEEISAANVQEKKN